MPDLKRVVGGIDTHKENHVAAVINEVGGVLATQAFPATTSGYQALIVWMMSFGQVLKVGIEGTGSYGAAIGERFAGLNIEVVEVNRPNRQMRRLRGKSDIVDAIAAARSALVGDAAAEPKRRDGIVQSIRSIRVAFTSLRDTRTRVTNQIHALIVSAPEVLRNQLQPMKTTNCIAACARFRPGDICDPIHGTRAALRALGRQHQELTKQLDELQAQLNTLVCHANLALVSAFGVGIDVASILLIVAGDNADRIKSEAAFAALCGVSPIQASSGKTQRHRLNRGGDRQGNHALWRIVMVRLAHHAETRAYAAKRKAEGKSNKEIVRCLKRYIAREIFQLLTNPESVPSGRTLRTLRQKTGISMQVVADRFNVHLTQISALEREQRFDAGLVVRYEAWLLNQTHVA